MALASGASEVHIIAWKRCREFIERHPDAEKPSRTWRRIIESRRFENPHQLKQLLPQTDFIGGHRTVFDVGGNKFRVVADVRYDLQNVYLRAVLTHEEYDDVDVEDL
jgi:mRNA interferase HigB